MFCVTFVLLFGLWVLLSGKFDSFHLTLGVISCVLIATLARDLFFQDRTHSLRYRFFEALRFFHYCIWLLKEIVLANLHVLNLAIHPRMMELIDPKIIKFDTILEKDFSRFVFANSITLTPGTVSVQVNGSEFIVHAISHKMASGLPGEMEQRVKEVFERDNKEDKS